MVMVMVMVMVRVRVRVTYRSAVSARGARDRVLEKEKRPEAYILKLLCVVLRHLGVHKHPIVCKKV